MEAERNLPQTFANGLTREQADEIDELRIEIKRLVGRIEALGRHRSYSLAVTKLEEGSQWLADRWSRQP